MYVCNYYVVSQGIDACLDVLENDKLAISFTVSSVCFCFGRLQEQQSEVSEQAAVNKFSWLIMKLSFLFPCCIARQVEIWLRWYKRSKQSHYILGFCGLCLIALVTLLRDLLLDMGVMCSASDVSADVHFKVILLLTVGGIFSSCFCNIISNSGERLATHKKICRYLLAFSFLKFKWANMIISCFLARFDV